MLAGQSTVDPMQKALDDINKRDIKQVSIPTMNGLGTEYANSNKWIAYLPIANVLGKEYSALELNLTRFSLPQMVMGSTTTSYKGYSVEFPTKVMDAESKQLTLEYIIDDNWQNYRALYAWMSSLEGNINKVIETGSSGISTEDYIDCRIWLINHFKKRVIDFVFENCWIKTFQDLSLEAANADEVHHSITLVYTNFRIADAVV